MFKRKVFFVSGYDPRGIGFYQGIVKKEAKKWSDLTNKTATVGKRNKINSLETEFKITSDELSIDYSFLHWDDLVRKTWRKSPLEFIKLMTTAYYYFYKHSDWDKFKQYPQGMELAFKLPFKVFLTFFLFIIVTIISALTLEFSPIIFLLLLIAGIVYIVYQFKKYSIMWILKTYMTAYSMLISNEFDWERRVKEWASNINEEDLSEYDEVWLVSHSFGTLLTPFLINNLYEANPNSNIKMLTMGSIMSYFVLLDTFKTGSDILDELAKKEFEWFDISSPADPMSFAMTSPFQQIENQSVIKAKTHLNSPRFHKAYEKNYYKKFKKDKLRVHFDYFHIPHKLGYSCYMDSLLRVDGLDALRTGDV